MYAFRQNPKDKDVSHLLCYIVAEAEWFTFYRLIPLFQKRALGLLSSLTDFLQKLEKKPASIEVKQRKASMVNILTDWADLNQYISGMKADIFEELLKSSNRNETIQSIQSEQTVRKHFSRFLKAASNDVDKVIFAIFGQQQILFVGENRRLVEDVLIAFLAYYPHPSVKLWAEEPSDCLLVGSPPGQVQNYPKGTVILDLDNRRVIGGEKNEFCANLIKKTEMFARTATVPETRIFVQTQVGAIFTLLKALLQAISLEGREERRRQFVTILKSSPETTVRLVGQMSKNLHPWLATRIQAFNMSSELGYM